MLLAWMADRARGRDTWVPQTHHLEALVCTCTEADEGLAWAICLPVSLQ